MDNSIYEVLRSDYVGFVEQIKPECRKTEIVEIGNNHIATKTIITPKKSKPAFNKSHKISTILTRASIIPLSPLL